MEIHFKHLTRNYTRAYTVAYCPCISHVHRHCHCFVYSINSIVITLICDSFKNIDLTERKEIYNVDKGGCHSVQTPINVTTRGQQQLGSTMSAERGEYSLLLGVYSILNSYCDLDAAPAMFITISS